MPVIDTSSWLTRLESSDWLKVSPQTLANYERRGLLHPQYAMRHDSRDIEHRCTVYNPDELAKLAKRINRHAMSPRDPGEIQARCCELLDQGKTVREIVVELREQFDVIRDLRDKWLDAGGADIVITPEAKKAFEQTVGAFTSVTDLVELITKKLASS